MSAHQAKIIIIPPDAFVSIDGVQHFGVDMSAAPEGVRAMRWQGSTGIVETDGGERYINSIKAWLPILQAINAAPPPPQPDPPPEQLRAARVAAVQAHLDAVAQGLGYDNIYTACTYADEPVVPRFQAEGRALRTWRSLVWAHCHAVLADVQADLRDIPTEAELLAELPALVLPD